MARDNRNDRLREHRSGEIINGELLVRGDDFIELELGRSRPIEIDVRFIDCPDHTPCNPHRDFLDWKVFHTRSRYILFITWKVQSVRELRWTVIF